MKHKNIIVIPPYYEGTSFQDIADGLKATVKNNQLPIDFLGAIKPLENSLNGELLDDKRYIAGQQSLIKNLINSDPVSKILFLDFFNLGFDLLRYFHEQQGHKCKYGALLHGGSFLKNDLYSWNWLKSFELAWFNSYDQIYVPSCFFANSIPYIFKKKIRVFPWGLDSFRSLKSNNNKTMNVVFPHRLNKDKGIDEFLKIVSRMPSTKFYVTSPQKEMFLKINPYFKKLSRYKNIIFLFGQSADEHRNVLLNSKIILSCAKQENFGYAVMKATASGCIPVLPNRLCYSEFFDNKFLYNNVTEAVRLINFYLNKQDVRNAKQIDGRLLKIRKNVKRFSFIYLLKDFFR
jgi:glycosyltransferase involved in cell wall biosynthesis